MGHGAGHRGAPGFHRLAQGFQRLFGKFRQFIEKQHAAMREGDLPGAGALAAAGERGLGGAVMRFPVGGALQHFSAHQHAGDRMDHADFQCVARRKIRQQAGQAGGEHGFAGAGRADEEEIVAAGGGDFQRPLGGFHAFDIRQVRAVIRVRHAGRFRRGHHLGAAEMVDE